MLQGRYTEMAQWTRYCLLTAMLLTLGTQCSSDAIVQRIVQVARSSNISNSDVREIRDIYKAGWWPLLQCIFLDDMNKCLQDRAVRALVGLGMEIIYAYKCCAKVYCICN